MKKYAWSVICSVLAVCAFVGAQDKDKKTTMSKEDQYHLRAVNSELDLIQSQINQVAAQLHAQEKVQEKDALVKKICADAKIDAAKCVPDTATGEVTERTDPPAAATEVKKSTKK